MSSRDEPSTTGRTSARTTGASSGLRVLVVDDNRDSAKTMALLLRKMGHEVETAFDGIEAVDAAVTFAPNVVLLDIGLPRLDGYEVARRIRGQRTIGPVTLIAMTGWGKDEDRRRSKAAGFDHHLVKPIDLAALEKLFTELAAGRTGGSPASGGAVAAVPAAARPGADRSSAELVAQMSHEIRTPLNTVLGTTRLLLDSSLDDEQREIAQTLRSASEELWANVDDLLDISSAESGQLDLDATPFSLAALAAECVASVEPLAAEKGLSVGSEVDPRVPAALIGDAVRLRRVMLHLLRNAVRSSDRGELSLRVSSRPLMDGRVELLVSIGDLQDAGRPLESDVDPSAASRLGRTDPGLVIARVLCERMSGRMTVGGEPGRGPAFHFTFAASEPTAGPRAPRSAEGAEPARPQRVLVADDDAFTRKMMILTLENFGCKAEAAKNGREALAAMSRTDYDLVLLDARMPEMDGVAALREMRRASPASRRPHVVAMTASTLRSDREALLAAGADACLTKPLAADTLRATLDGVYPPFAAPQAPAATPEVLDPSVIGALCSLVSRGGQDVLVEMIDLFLEETPLQMARIHDADVRGDAMQIEDAAHVMRGSCPLIGARRMSVLASELEKVAVERDLSAVSDVVGRLDAAWILTRAALQQARR